MRQQPAHGRVGGLRVDGPAGTRRATHGRSFGEQVDNLARFGGHGVEQASKLLAIFENLGERVERLDRRQRPRVDVFA